MTDAASFVVDFRYPHRIIRGSFEQSQKEDTELHALKLIKYTCLGHNQTSLQHKFNRYLGHTHDFGQIRITESVSCHQYHKATCNNSMNEMYGIIMS